MYSSKLTIFEGCDCSGKTTAAQRYANETGAQYVHLDERVGATSKELYQAFVDAMQPAILGYNDVVMDRCWISEPIYSAILGRPNRIDWSLRRLLERQALGARLSTVLCSPDINTVLEVFKGRSDKELLNEQQLRVCHEVYNHVSMTRFLQYNWCYATYDALYSMLEHQPYARTRGLGLDSYSAGNVDGSVVVAANTWCLNGTKLKERRSFVDDKDAVFMVATEWLQVMGLPESEVLWLDTADNKTFEAAFNNVCIDRCRRLYVALDDDAEKLFERWEVKFIRL